jgi:glucokinase
MIQADGAMHVGSTNLPNLAGRPLAEVFPALLGMPCRFDNDARSAMRGEAWRGAARGLRNALALTLGTGIGGGLLLDGRIRAGPHGSAGEIGVWRLGLEHESADWPTVEQIAAPSQLAEAFDVLIHDSAAAPIFNLVGQSIANAHLLLDLEAVVLCGAITAIGEPFRMAVERAFERACAADHRHGLSIRLGQLGEFAGALGAAALWRDEEDS